MAHDLVIRGGTVVDGTGSEAREADVAVDGDRVSAVGEVTGKGQREIDASGRLVTPGFVDIHTHLDAQLLWDPLGTPTCWHGVTTVVIGNCGVSFAPLRPSHHERLAGVLKFSTRHGQRTGELGEATIVGLLCLVLIGSSLLNLALGLLEFGERALVGLLGLAAFGLSSLDLALGLVE